MKHAKILAVCVVVAIGAYLVGRSTLEAQQPIPPLHQLPTPTVTVNCDPRTPISSLPFPITMGGSYYLTDNLTGVAGEDGITITAGDVTIDFNGYSLIGVLGSGYGVHIQGNSDNIAICNGALRNWGQGGIRALSAKFCQVDALRVLENVGPGIHVGQASRVSDCIVARNIGGIRGSAHAVITNCISLDNRPGAGIAPGIRSAIVGCTSDGNAPDYVLDGSTCADNNPEDCGVQ